LGGVFLTISYEKNRFSFYIGEFVRPRRVSVCVSDSYASGKIFTLGFDSEQA